MKNRATKNLAASISEAGIDSNASDEMINGDDRVCSICNRRASDHVDMDHPWQTRLTDCCGCRSTYCDPESRQKENRDHGLPWWWHPVLRCEKCGMVVQPDQT